MTRLLVLLLLLLLQLLLPPLLFLLHAEWGWLRRGQVGMCRGFGEKGLLLMLRCVVRKPSCHSVHCTVL